MGEFEFALVFFQRGLAIRPDISGFRDGVTKSRSAILDAINGVDLFQANANYSETRPRRPLYEVAEDAEAENPPPDPEQLKRTAELLPEKVDPLVSTSGQKEFLGELSLDYEYLVELRAEISNSEDQLGKKEDEIILSVVEEAISYLKQRSAFWSQQGGGQAVSESPEKSRSPSKTSPSRQTRASNAKTAHYEMSKIQQYEAKYGSPERRTQQSSKDPPPSETA
jgi:hypothetical protein